MTSVFDGMGDILTGVLGDVVTVTPPGGVAADIQAIFRDADVPVQTDEGVELLDGVPRLRAARDDVATAIGGGVVELGDGRRFKLLAEMKTGNPDPRGLTTIQLEAL